MLLCPAKNMASEKPRYDEMDWKYSFSHTQSKHSECHNSTKQLNVKEIPVPRKSVKFYCFKDGKIKEKTKRIAEGTYPCPMGRAWVLHASTTRKYHTTESPVASPGTPEGNITGNVNK